jgi:hypothetical protein
VAARRQAVAGHGPGGGGRRCTSCAAGPVRGSLADGRVSQKKLTDNRWESGEDRVGGESSRCRPTGSWRTTTRDSLWSKESLVATRRYTPVRRASSPFGPQASTVRSASRRTEPGRRPC